MNKKINYKIFNGSYNEDAKQWKRRIVAELKEVKHLVKLYQRNAMSTLVSKGTKQLNQLRAELEKIEAVVIVRKQRLKK